MPFTDTVHELIALAEEAAWARPARTAVGSPPMRPYPREVPGARRRLNDFLDGQPREVLVKLIGLMYAGRDRMGVRETRRHVARVFPTESAIATQMAGKGHWLPEYLRKGLARAERDGLDLDGRW